MYSPVEKQLTSNYCGPAVASAILKDFVPNASSDQHDIAQKLGVHGNEELYTKPEVLAHFLRSHNLTLTMLENATLEMCANALERNAKIIVCYTEPEGDGHYALLTNVEEHTITLDDPWHHFDAPILRHLFEERWHDSHYTKTNRLAIIVEKPAHEEDAAKRRSRK